MNALASAGAPDSQRLCALLVDDDEDQYVITRGWLSDVYGDHAALEWAPTFDRAVAAVRNRRHDVYLIDYSLGGENGIALLSELRRHGVGPVIMLTGEADARVDTEAMLAGASDYLVKQHLDAATLDRAIRYALDRTRAARQLQISEQRFRSLVEHSFEGIMILDASGSITYATPHAASILGHDLAEFMRLQPLALLHPDDVRNSEGVLAGLSASGASASCEFRCRHRDGTWRVLEAAIANRLDDPAVCGYVVNFRDVTERTTSMRALREMHHQSEELLTLLDTMQNAAPIGFAFLTCQFRYVRVNETMARLHGKAVEQHSGRAVAELLPELWAVLQPQCVQALETLRPVANIKLDVQIRSNPATKHWLCSFYPVRLNGDVTGIGIIVVDVTEQRQLEQQFLHAQRLESVGRLAGGVAHDFNNMLTVILGNADMLRERPISDQGQVENITEIVTAGKRAASLTQQLLAFSRKQVLQTKVFQLNDVVAGLERMLTRLIGEDITLVTTLAADLEPIDTDPHQLEQVIANLAINGRDAMTAGGRLTLETRMRELSHRDLGRAPATKAGRYAVLTVTDTGSGMDRETQAHIFEPFFTTKPGGQGTGLGLSTVYGIVSQSGGFIEVDSEIGKGTSFRVFLPAAAGQAVTPAEPPALEPDDLAGSETILVVEDSEPVRRLTTQLLRQRGYTILTAGSGEQALAVAEHHTGAIDVLLTDVVMPGMSGRALFEAMAPQRPAMAVVYCSGYTDEALGRHGVLSQGGAFLQKPFTASLLARTVRLALNKASTAERP